MATFDRTTIVRGPCKITYDGATFYSKGGVTFTATNSSFDKDTDAYGPVGKIKTDFQVVVEFEPVGEVEALTTLFPYASTAMGASLCGATDKPLVIVSASATYTVLNAIVTQMPSLRLSATATAFGSVQFTGLLKKDGDPTAIVDYYTLGAGAAIGVGFDPNKIICGPYYCSFPSNETYSEAGFEVSFDLSMNPVIVDGFGTVDMSITSLGLNLSFIPTGIGAGTVENYFDGFSAGSSLSTFDCQIRTDSVGGLDFSFVGQLIDVQNRFSPTDNIIGTVNIAAVREINTGVPEALFTLSAVTAP